MNILVIAPHPDDEIIGVGGTIAKFIAEGNNVYICVATKGSEPLFSNEGVMKTREEARKCHNLLGIKKTYYLDFPAVMLERVERYEINNKITKVINDALPNIVFIPHHGDIQKDHQIVSESALVALRPKYNHKVTKIYAYETLSETEWNLPHATNTFIPNVYIDISNYLDSKIKAMSLYKTQLADFPNPRSLEAIEALAKYRGATICSNAAEAFMLIREIA